MKNKKLWIDIFLFIDLLITFAIGLIFVNAHDMSLRVYHIILGILFFLLLVLHFWVNGRGWFVAGLNLFRGERYSKVRWRYIMDWLLLVVWLVVLVTGLLHLLQIGGGHMQGGPGTGMGLHMGNGQHGGGMESGKGASLLSVQNLHFIFSIIGTALIGVHIFQHIRQIKAYFRRHAKNA